ncbi:MAG TPA: GH3 auxin-responsive promoter family protein, partial [Parafilimonas sp.]|nr:GH3 auxin-responsive promoter family protein [Parafilimonas sp.]
MYLKSLLAKPFANYIYNKTKKWAATAVEDQETLMKSLVKTAKNTEFGKEHKFESIQSYENFTQQIPVRDYEDIKPYIDRIK